MNVKIGTKAEAAALVTERDTAAAMGSGTLDVLATPRLAALMEQAAVLAAAEGLDEGETTVGTALNITHEAPTPVGMKVRAEAVVTAAEGRKLCFEVTAWDERGRIGGGTHERFAVNGERFAAKCRAKLNGGERTEN